jgi:hypothetical protein
MVYRQRAEFGKGCRALSGAVCNPIVSAHTGALAALALDDVIALFQQALAFAILAFLLLLDVRPFFIGHDVFLSLAAVTMIQPGMAIYTTSLQSERSP